MCYLNYFVNSYEEGKERFLKLSKTYAGNKKAEFLSLPITGCPSNDLTTDIVYVPAVRDKNNLVIIISGVHGIEGYLGSSIMSLCLDSLLEKHINTEYTGVLLIHTVNPWGYKNKRRTNSCNIDLNRNFETDITAFSLENKSYTKINNFLNPSRSYHHTISHDVSFWVTAIYLGIRYGMETLINSILKGQYQIPEGLFYGGTNFAGEKESLDKILKKYLKDYNKILGIDIHTGYGKKGKLHFLQSNCLPENSKKYMKEVYCGYDIKTEYYATGIFTDYLVKLSHKNQIIIPITYEYGTADSHKLLRIFKSLKIMIGENQLYHFGYENEQDKNHILNLFKELFYPSDTTGWRIPVMQQTAEVLPKIFERFQKLEIS